MKIPLQVQIGIGAGVVVLAAVFWLTRKGNAKAAGEAVGGAAVDAVVGVAHGAGSAVVEAANNPDINPLQPFGAWLGGQIYDFTHMGQ